MDMIEIERFATEKIRRSVETAAEDLVRQLNDRGHDFVPDPGAVFEWVDESARLVLAIDCALGVSVGPSTGIVLPPDPEVERYIEMAESGEDGMATVLNRLEGDIANGGFLQLLDNKGASFVRQAIQDLVKIGATEAAAIVEHALELMASHEAVLAEYDAYQLQLDSCDARFHEVCEDIPRLFLEYRNQEGA